MKSQPFGFDSASASASVFAQSATPDTDADTDAEWLDWYAIFGPSLRRKNLKNFRWVIPSAGI
jgi:hypothetical protein